MFFGKIKIIGAVVTILLMAACYGTIGEFTDSKYGGQNSDDTAINNLEESDLDGDLFTADIDCDDVNPLVHPSAIEKCKDGVDNNCDGLTDDTDPTCN